MRRFLLLAIIAILALTAASPAPVSAQRGGRDFIEEAIEEGQLGNLGGQKLRTLAGNAAQKIQLFSAIAMVFGLIVAGFILMFVGWNGIVRALMVLAGGAVIWLSGNIVGYFLSAFASGG